MSKVIIHIFSIMRNEEKLLPYFLRHYETFADKIYIFNDNSTDKTVEIAKNRPKVVIMDFPYNRGLHEDDFSDCFQQSYKKYSRGVADWVMCVDGDEFIYNKNIKEFLQLQAKKGRKVLRTRGWDMVSDKFPTTKGQIYEECNMGYWNTLYNKMVVINPSVDVVFGQGRHKIEPIDDVETSKVDLLLLHYKYLSREYFLEHYVNSFSRRFGLNDKTMHYKSKRGLARFSDDFKKNLEKVI